MKQFLTKIAIILVLSVLILEVLVRVLNLASIQVPAQNINDNMLFQKNFKGKWVKGGLGEIKANININNQGWNSIKDYSNIDSNKINYALIGDSYIEGFHENVETSIGRRIESLMNDSVEVHEYGHSDGNIFDYVLLYKEIEKKPYHKVIILITNGDLMQSKAIFMNQGVLVQEESLIKRIYYKFAFLRYLIKNQGLLMNFKKSFMELISKESYVETLDPIYFDFSVFNKDKTIFIYEANKFNPTILDSLGYNCVEINHKLKPYSFGFDKHWNTNGRINCAESILSALKN